MEISPERGQYIGKYKLVMKLWDGSFGETWKAQASRSEPVVVQIIADPLLAQEINRQTIDVFDISNACLARLLTIEQEPTSLIWEYVAGRRLHTYVRQLKKIKPHIAVYIARKILEIMTFTASKGMVHGGLRASRVVITPDKRVILTNFGIGHLEQRVLSRIFNGRSHSELQKFAKILAYFPQEVLEDQLFDDPKCDIYAAGILLAQMLTGRCVGSDQMVSLLGQYDIPGNLSSIILKAVADFGERYNHPNEMYQQLTQLLKMSDEVEKIYVPPPNIGIKNIALEAIPADSEEYRVYEADIISARQSIDAEVVAAEPADFEEHSPMPPQRDGAPTPRKTVRMDAEALLLISTIDKKILDPLEKKAVWPGILLQFSLAAAIAIFLLLLVAAAWPVRQESTSPAWILAPFYALRQCPLAIEVLGYVILCGQLLFFLFFPWIDPRSRLRHSPVLLFLVTFFLFMLFGLGLLGIAS